MEYVDIETKINWAVRAVGDQAYSSYCKYYDGDPPDPPQDHTDYHYKLLPDDVKAALTKRDFYIRVRSHCRVRQGR